MMIHQVQFLIEGYLLPPTIGRLQISENLVLEQVLANGVKTIAYVAVVTQSEGENYFRLAQDYLDFFIVIYALVSGQAVTTMPGIGTTIDDITSLGTKSVGFSSFERIEGAGVREDDFVSKSILESKKRFLLLLPDRQKIMESPLGLALTYYYYAVRESTRLLEEAVIHLMIAAEALLIIEDKNKCENLSRRLSTLVAENETEKVEISRKMRKLYALRSSIVHGGGKKPSLGEVRVLFPYVRRAIECGLSSRHLTKQELVAKLDKCAQHEGT